MKKRVLRIIEREKKDRPNASNMSLLFHGLYKGFIRRYEVFLINFKKNSTFNSEKDLWMCSLFPQKVLDIIISEIKPKSILDVGCGTGVSLNYFVKNGIDAFGLENSKKAIQKSSVKERITKHNLNRTYRSNHFFDLVWCFEVVEHIHPDYEANFLKTLVSNSNIIVLSAARPGQGGHGHFNEQMPEYWIGKFSDLGFQIEQDITEKLRNTGDTHAENILCFKKSVL